jgi:hypothetical protein
MVRLVYKISLMALFLSLFLISGCTKYVCYDGSVEKDESKCPLYNEPRVVQRQAEMAVDTYASAYASALGSRHSRVNTYRSEGNWYSEVLMTNTKTGTVSHITLKIDGVTSSVSCVEGCEHLLKEVVGDVVIEQNLTNNDVDFTIY